ncbi:DinB family protein [Candidatus Palauibacter sp.]|uniref:DinB family protein n=1 Tax=Candidatus Palauibacter sp. TaxID=3101350 RepID=UPI003CC684B9
MSAQGTLNAFDHIVAGCRTALEAVPDDRLDWRPHEKSWTLGELATHVAMIPNWTMPTLTMSEFDIGAGDGPPPNPELTSSADLVAALDGSAATARQTIEATSDEVFASSWTMKVGGETRFTMPKAVVLRSLILDHLIHHRAQLGVYLRLLDVPVPQMFGPTADFPDM